MSREGPRRPSAATADEEARAEGGRAHQNARKNMNDAAEAAEGRGRRVRQNPKLMGSSPGPPPAVGAMAREDAAPSESPRQIGGVQARKSRGGRPAGEVAELRGVARLAARVEGPAAEVAFVHVARAVRGDQEKSEARHARRENGSSASSGGGGSSVAPPCSARRSFMTSQWLLRPTRCGAYQGCAASQNDPRARLRRARSASRAASGAAPRRASSEPRPARR